MQARTPRKASTMAHRFLETSLPSSQKGKTSHFSPTRRKNCYSHLSLSSSRYSLSSTISASSIFVRAPSLPETHSQHSLHTLPKCRPSSLPPSGTGLQKTAYKGSFRWPRHPHTPTQQKSPPSSTSKLSPIR